jgi:hypothetical protein
MLFDLNYERMNFFFFDDLCAFWEEKENLWWGEGKYHFIRAIHILEDWEN